MQTKDGRDLPLGFGMALMQNPRAYVAFAQMDTSAQNRLLAAAHDIDSPSEMRAMIDKIPNEGAKL